MENENQTLGEFIIESENKRNDISGALFKIFSAIELAAKIVNYNVNAMSARALDTEPMNSGMKETLQINKKVSANEIFSKTIANKKIACGVSLNENDNFVSVQSGNTSVDQEYVILINSEDGGDNPSNNFIIGTTFSVYRRVSEVGTPITIEDFLQKGVNQVASGYIFYGQKSMLVCTSGNGVNGFTLNMSLGTFFLSHPNMKIEDCGPKYFMNKEALDLYSTILKKYPTNFLQNIENQGMLTENSEGFVINMHQILICGGICLYPESANNNFINLRLV